MKIRTLGHCAISALLAGLVPCYSGAEDRTASSNHVVVGNPAKGADLPAAILKAYANGAREITIAPGTYKIPPTGKCAISLERWTNGAIYAKGVTLVFEDLKKADNGLIEGCTISGCGMSAISIGPEYWWGEADYSQNVTMKGNTLRNNVLNGSDAGVIFVHGDGAIGNRNITITGNRFDGNYGQIAVHAEDTDGIRIVDNHFITSAIRLSAKARTVLDFTSTKNITLRGNVVENSAPNDILVNLGRNVGGVVGNDATGITLAPKKTDRFNHAPTPHQ